MSKSLQSHGLEPTGISVHGIFQAGILEWITISFSKYGVEWTFNLVWLVSLEKEDIWALICIQEEHYEKKKDVSMRQGAPMIASKLIETS